LITRLIAIVPAILVITIFGDDKLDTLLILSQVILSVQLGFAVIPLIHFVSDKETMGVFTIKPITKIISWLIAIVLIYLNVQNLIEQAKPIFESPDLFYWKALIILLSIIFVWLFCMMTFIPLIKKQMNNASTKIHGEPKMLNNLQINPLNRIAIALDFSDQDEKLIAHAIAQGNNQTNFILLHVVESATAKYLGKEVDDEETRKDKLRLEMYAQQLVDWGYSATSAMGYRNRIKEIVRLVNESDADMLVMGAHRHTGIKDYLFGETIDSVRHQLSIPVLIVNL
jgi:manganese transport protein